MLLLPLLLLFTAADAAAAASRARYTERAFDFSPLLHAAYARYYAFAFRRHAAA